MMSSSLAPSVVWFWAVCTAACTAGGRLVMGVAAPGGWLPTCRTMLPPVTVTVWPLRVTNVARAAPGAWPGDGNTNACVSCVAGLNTITTIVPLIAATPLGVEMLKFDWRARTSCTAACDTWARTLPATTWNEASRSRLALS